MKSSEVAIIFLPLFDELQYYEIVNNCPGWGSKPLPTLSEKFRKVRG